MTTPTRSSPNPRRRTGQTRPPVYGSNPEELVELGELGPAPALAATTLASAVVVESSVVVVLHGVAAA
jgi:hypothetical protein